MKRFPVINPMATGRNIARLRREKGLSVRDLQQWFGFEEPQAIYKWQQGKSLPSVDNLYALCALLEVSMEELLVEQTEEENEEEQQDESCCPLFLEVNEYDRAGDPAGKRGDPPSGSYARLCRIKSNCTINGG